MILLLALTVQGQDLVWTLPAREAVESSLLSGKPLILHFVAGPQAAVFAQELDRLWSLWPQWSRTLSSQVIPVRVRSWDGTLPPEFPPLPGAGKSSVLAIWLPGATTWAATWQGVPAVLELSHTLGRVASLTLEDPYQTDLTVIEVADGLPGPHRFDRQESGPIWVETSGTQTHTWREEGPLGSLLILTDPTSPRKLAFPFESDWAFASSAATQSWAPWFRVTVVRQ